MKISTNLKIATVLIGALPAALGAVEAASAASDPTAGRIRGYQKCLDFSKRVLHASLTQSKGDRAKIHAAYAHYHGNVARCKTRYGV